MIQPDRREGNIPVVTELFPLKSTFCTMAIRDIREEGKTREESLAFSEGNGLLFKTATLHGIIRYGERQELDSYTLGMLLSYRAHREEAYSSGGLPSRFEQDDLAKFNNFYSNSIIANFVHRCLLYNMSDLGLSAEQSVEDLREKRPKTFEQFLADLISSHKKLKAAFRDQEEVFHKLLFARGSNSYDDYQDAMLNGIVGVWGAFQFLKQREAA